MTIRLLFSKKIVFIILSLRSCQILYNSIYRNEKKIIMILILIYLLQKLQ